MRKFFSRQDGYVLVLVLISMPIFIGLCVLVIDIGRGNNTHSDLYAAADAVALAGARELDGGTDAIDRAKLAMTKLTNNASFLGNSGGDVAQLIFDDTSTNTSNEGFTAFFLKDIPDDDHTPIDTAFILANRASDATEDALARYVYVAANTNNFSSIFYRLASFASGPVSIRASAVATQVSVACDVTPIYICNPFEDGPLTAGLQESFAQGKLHGRMLNLHLSGNDTESPGNFGFLQVDGSSSAAAIRDIFATGVNPTCYESGEVTTKPGGANAIRQGINVRFDIFEGPYSGNTSDPLYPPAKNVRKGYTYVGDACTASLDASSPAVAMGFPPNDATASPINGVPGALIGVGDWDMETYWNMNHDYPVGDGTAFSSLTEAELDAMNSFPLGAGIYPGADMPSRYDVYKYEIEQSETTINNLLANTSAGNEEGNPICSSISGPEKDRRVMFAAIVNCNSDEVIAEGGGVNTYPVEAYASFFMVNPMPSGSPANINVEIIDITGFGGNGTLDEFVRDESILVR